MIKYKHCCKLNNKDYIEAEAVKDVVKINVFDYELNTEIELHLDKKTAIRFAKTVRTEINKIY